MEYKRFYVIRTKMRADGDVDFDKEEKYTLASALSDYYTKKAAAVVDTTYPQIAIMVVDHELNVIEQCLVNTQYTA